MIQSELYYTKIAERAAQCALDIASDYINNPGVIIDDNKDIKTKADLLLNEKIISELMITDIPIISEEIEYSSDHLPDLCWVIDPLDGTYNYTRKFPFSGVSIALLKNSKPIIGVVVDIFGEHIFSSSKGYGASKNCIKISVSKIDQIKNAVLVTGFPSGTSYETAHLYKFVHSVQDFKKVRALGAASLMLSLVAEGIFDVYYEKDIFLWDIAAGLCLIEEAGGKYILRKTIGQFQYEVIASNAEVFDQACALIFGQ